MTRAPRVLVVGGGIAGLAARRALRAEGIDVCLVERAGSWRPAGAGMFLPGNTARCLRRLGIEEAAFLAHGHRIDRQVVTDDTGTPLGEADLVALWGDVGPSVGIHRAALHALLLGDDDGDVDDIRLGTTVLATTPRRHGVDVVFAGGTTEAFDLVVGADGVHSALRTALFPHAEVRFGRETYYRTVVDNVVGLDHWAGAWCDDTLLGLVPIGGGRLYCFGAVFGPAPHEPDPPLILDFRKHFAGLGDPFGRVVEEVHEEQLLLGPAMTVTADPPVAGRVVLIGDAAHANPPSMAQGAAQAMEDALVLAEMLVCHDVDDALPRFAERRRARTTHVRDTTALRTLVSLKPPAERDPFMRAWGPVTSIALAPLVEAP